MLKKKDYKRIIATTATCLAAFIQALTPAMAGTFVTDVSATLPAKSVTAASSGAESKSVTATAATAAVALTAWTEKTSTESALAQVQAEAQIEAKIEAKTESVTAIPSNMEEVVIEAETKEYVTYTRYTVSKGNYSTRIWNQHFYWRDGCSAARHGCGICTTAMVLQLKGKDYTPNDVLRQNGRSTKRCAAFAPAAAQKYLKKKGINSTLYYTKSRSRASSGNIMTSALKNGRMVMALVSGAPFSHNTHWILLVGYDRNGNVVVANSSNGYHNICLDNDRQYQLVSMKTVYNKLNRGSKKWSYFLVIE